MQIQRHPIDYLLFTTVILLTAAGVITVFSASTYIALQSNAPADSYALRQLISAAVGLAGMIGLSWVPHRIWYRYAAPVMGIGLFLLLIVLIPHVGWSTNGGRRWIGHGSFHLQPSELAIIATVVYLSFFFTKQVTMMDNFKRGLMPALVVAGINVVLIFVEPDMGTAMTLLGTSLVIVFASGARVKRLVITMLIVTPVLVIAAMKASYRSARLASWLHPFQHMDSASYQLIQGMTAISAGGWFGRGFDMSLEKAGYLPYPQTDFIFPVFVEEWGFVGAIALIATFAFLVWRGFRIARRSPDRFGSLLAVGLTCMIIISSIINLGAVTGLLPVTGIPLPFMSYGGTDLIVNMAAMGILLSISRVTLAEEPEADELADIVSVEDMEERRERRAPVSKPPVAGLDIVAQRREAEALRRKAESHRKAESRHRAEVHRLRDARDSRKQADAGRTSSGGGWRSRSAQNDSWRARQETAATSRGGSAGTTREAGTRGSGTRGTGARSDSGSRSSSTRSTRQPIPTSKSWINRQSGSQTARPTESKDKKTSRFSRKER
ncbi:putative lipid II flippase FtsW [Alicyclobacillus ferrooxydans]|uniref:putative lipid II flippase FtsW n=1 Tax=Alicyclobacillus ferrooxydans TaxID=471514 RepID=UPI0006D59E7A|nr:putative lipid II flippase FtsW [Alicyclobacillus ferrooxydans]